MSTKVSDDLFLTPHGDFIELSSCADEVTVRISIDEITPLVSALLEQKSARATADHIHQYLCSCIVCGERLSASLKSQP